MLVMSKLICNNCESTDFKVSKKEYTIRSRHSEKSTIIIEDFIMSECKICGHLEVPESSEKYIEAIRRKIKKEMEAKSIENNLNALSNHSKFDGFVGFIKKLIG